MKRAILYFTACSLFLGMMSCRMPGKNNPGSEYMPDMGHSIAYEANVNGYYYFNTWGTEADYKKLAQPRLPVNGTVPRGMAGISWDDQSRMDHMQGYPMNGYVPFYYANTEDERKRAMREITRNPYPISAAGLARGKELYTVYCGICHGEKADGAGYLVRDDGGVYPAQPANLVSDSFTLASEGRFYFGIMYGKNVMGGYSDKLSYEERWDVIHYIRSLQAAAKQLVYNEEKNTLNTSATPLKSVVRTAPAGVPGPQGGAPEEKPANPETHPSGNSH